MEERTRLDEFARLATEQRNPRPTDLDRLATGALLELISEVDRAVPAAVAKELPAIARAVDLVSPASARAGA